MKQNLNDPVIDEIRDVRHRISARFGHDPARLVSFYLEMQEQYQDRLIETAENTNRRNQPATSPGPLTDTASRNAALGRHASNH